MAEYLSPEEKLAIEKFRLRMKDEIPPELQDDPTLYYRFMRARDFKLHQAEVMLRKHIEWRKQNQIDTILKTYKPMEVLDKYWPQNFIGFDKEGCPIRYTVPGKIDIKGVFKSANLNDIWKAIFYVLQSDEVLVKKQSEKLGREVRLVYLYDLSEITLAKAANKKGMDILLNFLSMAQDNYPERLKCAYIFNAPPYLTAIFAILTRLMSTRLQQKVRYFGTEGWKEALLEMIDADALPAFLGGKRTDPDGNPLCLTFVSHAGIVPDHYYRKSVQKILKAIPSAQKVTVNSRSKAEVSLIVHDPGSFVEWEFQTLSQDIGFGLFYREKDDGDECAVIMPVERKSMDGNTVKGVHKCTNEGTYILLFDNSYSWMNSKEVYYQVTIINPT